MFLPSGNCQRGNVLFMILIAVALFAALSYAVTSSNRGSGNNVSNETAAAQAAAIVQYGATLKNAVMRMMVSNGCTEATLDFSNNIFTMTNGSTYTMAANSAAPVQCKLFYSTGGNIAPAILPPAAIDVDRTLAVNAGTPKTGHAVIRIFQVMNVGTDGPAGTLSANDIVFMHMYLNRRTCLAINDILHIPNPGGEPPSIDKVGSTGSYTNGSLTSTQVLDDPSLNGQAAFCRFETSGSRYDFNQVVLER